MLRGGADESEAAQLRAAEGWIDFSDGRSATKKTVKARPDKYGAGSEEWRCRELWGVYPTLISYVHLTSVSRQSHTDVNL